jgi:hypothetical protein
MKVTERDKMTADWRKLLKEELPNLKIRLIQNNNFIKEFYKHDDKISSGNFPNS